MYSVLNCRDVAKYTEVYLEELRFNVTSTGNAGCSEKGFTMVFQMLLFGERYENVYTSKRTNYPAFKVFNDE
jgi:hypothetical protein